MYKWFLKAALKTKVWIETDIQPISYYRLVSLTLKTIKDLN